MRLFPSAAIGCAVGMTCANPAPIHNEEGAHSFVETSAIAPDLPTPIPTTSSGGPFWEPIETGKAVPILRADAPNMHYASLDRVTCEAELTKRNIAFAPAGAVTGVMAPERLRGPLSSGVSIHSLLPPSERERAAMEIFDCRLLLALDDFSAMLAKRDVVEMIHLSAYRPRSQFGCTQKYDGKQHCGALAVDIATFKRKDGSSLDVTRDFHGHVGSPTCTTSPRPNELWSFVCDAADRATFNVMLTPNFNAQHFNHVHVEITPDAAWMMVH